MPLCDFKYIYERSTMPADNEIGHITEDSSSGPAQDNALKEEGCLDKTHSNALGTVDEIKTRLVFSFGFISCYNATKHDGFLWTIVGNYFDLNPPPTAWGMQVCEIEGYRIAGRTTSCVHAWLDSCCACVKKLEEYTPYARGISDARVKSFSSIHSQTSFRLLRALKSPEAVCELLRATFCHASARTKICDSPLVF
jgi:hypothetical protein